MLDSLNLDIQSVNILKIHCDLLQRIFYLEISCDLIKFHDILQVILMFMTYYLLVILLFA